MDRDFIDGLKVRGAFIIAYLLLTIEPPRLNNVSKIRAANNGRLRHIFAERKPYVHQFSFKKQPSKLNLRWLFLIFLIDFQKVIHGKFLLM